MGTTFPQEIKFKDSVISQEIGDELVLLNMRDEAYFSLNNVGASFWSLINEGLNCGEAAAALKARFDVAEEQLHFDLRQLIDDMEAKGLITVSR